MEERIPEIEYLPISIVGIIDADIFKLSSICQNQDIMRYTKILRENANKGFDCVLELEENGLRQRMFFNV